MTAFETSDFNTRVTERFERIAALQATLIRTHRVQMQNIGAPATAIGQQPVGARLVVAARTVGLPADTIVLRQSNNRT